MPRQVAPHPGARTLRERWRLVAEAEQEELRRTPIEVKATQLAALMASVRALGWEQALAEEDEEVWRRWQALRAKFRG